MCFFRSVSLFRMILIQAFVVHRLFYKYKKKLCGKCKLSNMRAANNTLEFRKFYMHVGMS